MGKKRSSRAGRKRDPEARRHQTTVEGRAQQPRAKCECCGLPTSLAVRKRLELAGDAKTGDGFPLDVLLTLRLVSEDERDQGLRFAQLSWWLYGLPVTGPELLYERMVTGAVDVDLAPRRELHITMDDPDAAREELLRIERNKARYERMVEALRRAAPRDLVLGAVKRATQLLQMPPFVLTVGLANTSPEAWYEMARLKMGLRILVKQRDAEDRYHGRARSRKSERP